MTVNAENSTKSAAGKYLTFMASKERYGLDILKVQEIIKVAQITKVPKCADYIKGVINLRGKIIPVFDLRTKFRIPPAPYDDKTCIVVINISKGEQRVAIGVIVDTVLEVLNFASDEIELSPNYGEHLDTKFIIGMGKRDQNLNILIDIEKIINQKDQVGLTGIAG